MNDVSKGFSRSISGQSILDQITDPVIGVDFEGTVLFWNMEAERLYGRSSDKILGQSLSNAFRQEWLGDETDMLEKVRSGGIATGGAFHLLHDGRRIFVEYRISLLRDDDGKEIGLLQVIREVSDSHARALRPTARVPYLDGVAKSALLDSVSDAIFTTTLDGSITYWNQGAERLYGWTVAEVLGKNEVEIFRAEFPIPTDQLTGLFLRNGHWEGEVTRHRKSGEPLTVSSRWSLLRDTDGKPAARMVINTDLTETKIAFEELRRAEAEASARAAELAAILDAMPGATFIAHDPECRTMTSSVAAYELLRLPRGSNSSKSAPSEERPTTFRVMKDGREVPPEELPVQQAAATGRPVIDAEVTIVFDDGTSRDILGNAVPLLDRVGKVRGAVGSFVDITERKRNEEQGALSENRYRSLVHASSNIIWTADVNGHPLGDLASWRAFTGQTLAEVAGDGTGDAIHPDDRERTMRSIQESIALGRPYQIEHRIRRHDGVYRTMFARAVPVRDIQGNIVEWVGIHTDITEQRLAEEALRHSESRFRRLFDSGLIGIGFPDRFGGFSDGNDELLRIVGYTREDMLAGLVRWDVMTPPEYKELDARHIAEAAQFGSCTPYEKEYIRKDGTKVPILCGYAFLEGSLDECVGFVQDLTEQKESEAALKEREQRFSALAENLPQLIWVADAEGRNTYCNRGCLDYHGLEPEQAVGNFWQDMIHPGDQDSTVAKWNHSVETGEPYSADFRLRRRDGVYRHFVSRGVPVYSAAGNIERWVGVSTDVHDQKILEEALRRTEKLEAVGRLAASVAHAINNPLESVTNSLYLALLDDSLSETTRTHLQVADHELRRVAQVTAQSLRFHKQSTLPAVVDIGGLMDATLLVFARRCDQANVTVERDYRSQQRLLCYAEDLRQVFAHLLSNSLDAITRDGRLRIRIRESRTWDAAEERGIKVIVADTGAGIPVDIRSSVFEAFVSTKNPTGAGLGLWVTEGIVRKHNGRVALRSRTHFSHHGTVIALFFPFLGVGE